MRLERAVASCLLVLHPILPSFAHGHGDPVIYSYIETRLPVAVSDLTATYWPGGPYIYLFGGCDSSKGNERADFDPELFYCTSVTDRVWMQRSFAIDSRAVRRRSDLGTVLSLNAGLRF